MKKIFNKFTKILLLVAMVISDLMTPIKVFAAGETPSTNEEPVSSVTMVFNNGSDVTESRKDATGNIVLQEGDLEVTKSVEEDASTGKYKVNFELTGKGKMETKPIYSIVVLDRSGSMREVPNKWENAKQAAMTYSSTLANGTNKFGLIRFNNTVQAIRYDTSVPKYDFSTREFPDNQFGNPEHGTWLYSALKEAEKYLVNVPEGTRPVIVVIGDGAADDYAAKWNPDHNDYEYGLFVVPDNLKEHPETIPADYKFEDSTWLANLKEKATIYSIGYNLDELDASEVGRAKAILKCIVSDDGKYIPADVDTLVSEITDLATKISNDAAGAVLKEVPNDAAFSFTGNNNGTNGEKTLKVTNIDEDTHIITYEPISYDIEIKDNLSTGVYLTNDTTSTKIYVPGENGNDKLIGNITQSPSIKWVSYKINYYKDSVSDNNFLGTTGFVKAPSNSFTLTETQKYLSEESKQQLINDGYELSETNNYNVTVSETDPTVVNILYEKKKLNYIVEYFFEGDNNTYTEDTNLRLSTNTCKHGDEINAMDKILAANDIPTGYVLDETKTKEINNGKYTITENNTEVKVYYKKRELTYGYKYLFEDLNGNYAEDNNYQGNSSVSAKYGDEVNYTKHALDSIPTGFELNTSMTEGTNNGTYTITDNNTMINIYYNRLNLTYKVRYYFQDLNGNYVELGNVQGLDNVAAKYGKEVSYNDHILANVPEGYILDTVQSKNVTDQKDGNYVIINNDTIVKVYYMRTNQKLTVNYRFNGEFADDYSYINNSVMYGSTLNAADYELETVNSTYLNNKETTDNKDYFLDPTDSNNSTSVTVGTDDITMELHYISTFFEDNAENVTKSSTTKEVTSSNQPVDYTITYENTIKNVREGDVITVTVTDTLPFEIDTTNANTNLKIRDNNKEIEGVYDNSNKTITWTFEMTASEFTSEYIITKTIPFTVVYKDFADISANEDNKLVNTASGKTTINGNSTDGDTSDSEEIPVKIEGNLVVRHYEKDTTFEVANKEEYTGLVGASYADKTNYKTDIIGYSYDSVTGDENGNYIEGTKEVIYYYTRKDGEIENPTTTKTFVKKDGQTKNEVEGIDSTFKYTINAKATVKDFVGNVKVVATDYLPYEINIKESKLNGCSYDASNKTITCSKDFGEITKDNYTTNDDGEYVFEINVSFDLELVYEGIKDKTVENSAKINVLLNEKEREDGESPIVTETVEVKEGTLEVVYKSKEKVFESSTTTKLADTDYTTSEKSFFGYHLVEVKGNRKGKYLPNQTVTVEYIYELNDGEITNNKVTKEGPEIISDVNDYTEYVFTYDGTVKNYIGKATLTVTDILPYEIYSAGYDDRCDYDFDSNTFTCKVEYDITEEDYVNGEYNIHEEFHLSVIYGEIDSDVITNKVDSKLELRKVYKDSESSVDSKILKGELLVSYVDEEGNALDSYTITDHAGLYYETEEREFEGYSFKSSSDNTEGFLIANETVYVEYVYSKNIGTYEELPPFTGVEDISTNHIGYILAALFLLLIGKKKEVKNN